MNELEGSLQKGKLASKIIYLEVDIYIGHWDFPCYLEEFQHTHYEVARIKKLLLVTFVWRSEICFA